MNFKNLISNVYNLQSKVFQTSDQRFENLRSNNIYCISNNSFLTFLDFNIFDIDLIVYYASFEMLHTEVRFLQSNNLLLNPKIVNLWVSSTIVQYNTILTEMVQNCFEDMINYIIAVTLHVKRNNVRSYCSYSCQPTFSQMILLQSWIHIGLILFPGSLLNSIPLHQARCVWFALGPVKLMPWCFSTVFICKSRQTTNVSEMTRICSGNECSTFDGAEQFFIAELHGLSRKFSLWMLCGCSCKAFWSATFVIIL